MKAGMVALVVKTQDNKSELVDALCDDQEISTFQEALQKNDQDPLQVVYRLRRDQEREDEEFGDYVEELLSQPFLRPEIQQHGIQWLKSKIRIEEFRKKESDATKVIADYAFKVYRDNPNRSDFVLSGPTANVRIRVYRLPEAAPAKPNSQPGTARDQAA